MSRHHTKLDGEFGDLLGPHYWDANWLTARRRRYRPWNYYHVAQETFLRSFLRPGGRFLELGCADSIWLSHFAGRGEIWGIDYSPVGVERLSADHAPGRAHVVLGDLFDLDNPVPRNYFDVVVSDGLLEHFSAAEEAIRAFATYARPGGVVVTSVPNMYGLIGLLHRLSDPELFSAHIPYRPADLDRVHARAGLEPIAPAHYWGHFSLGVLSYRRILRSMPHPVSTSLMLSIMVMQQIPAWLLKLGHLPDGGFISPHLRGAYQKP